jgi:hypothetical protein
MLFKSEPTIVGLGIISPRGRSSSPMPAGLESFEVRGARAQQSGALNAFFCVP